MRLNKKDLRLLFELDSNYRRPYSKIGRKIRMSPQLINYKVKSLFSEGAIISYFPLMDYSRLGYLGFRVFFNINYFSREKFLQMVEKIKGNGNIMSVMECDGRYDLMTLFVSKNPSSFNKSLRELIASHPKQLKNCTVLTTVVEHHFPRSYLVGKAPDRDIVIGGDRETMQFDETDKTILDALIKGKKSIVEISGAAKVTPKTALSRLKALEKRGVIMGYTTAINARKIGFSTDKILIKYYAISVAREGELAAFCRNHPNIIELTKTFGEWDLELTVETRTREEFRNVCMTLREKFEDVIMDFDNFRVFKIHKNRTLPDWSPSAA